MMKYILMIALAIIMDFVLGDPYTWPHPVVYMGKLIKKLEKRFRETKIDLKVCGFLIVIISVATTFLVSHYSIKLLSYIDNGRGIKIGDIFAVYLMYTTLATKCLKDEVKKVKKVVESKDLMKARAQISYLVGRDTSSLSFDEITRAAVETAAENTIDGILAPLFYMCIGAFFNMPAEFALVYKMINTMDSMLGYIQEPYTKIGFAPAKLDDIVNYIPARIGSLFMLFGGACVNLDFKNGFKILLRDRKNHKSPNCGYPEAAVAGLLNVRLGGTNTYFGEVLVKPTLGDNNIELKPIHIDETSKIMYTSEVLMFFVFALIFVLM